MSLKKETEQLFKKYENYAKDNGFHLNPDRKVVDCLIKSLIQREKKYGKRYCPCRRLKESPGKNDKIVCPCIYHKKEIEKDGHCYCFLFVK